MFIFLAYLALLGVGFATLYEAPELYCAFLALSVVFLIMDTLREKSQG